MKETSEICERTAYDTGDVARSSVRYASASAPQEPLRQRLRELVQMRATYGYGEQQNLLYREGWSVDHQRVQRLDRDEGRAQRRERMKRRRSAPPRMSLPIPGAANEREQMDFMLSHFADGAAIRVFNTSDL